MQPELTAAVLTSILTAAPISRAHGESCVVPVSWGHHEVVSVTEASRRTCLQHARIVRPQPPLSLEGSRRGPDGAKAISQDEPVFCEFIPYKMHLKGGGKSRKFWCRRTNAAGNYYNDRHDLVPGAVAVSAEGHLLDPAGETILHEDGAPQRPEVLKVKYSNGDNRGREVHTEVAAARLFWALGFPSDRMYAARVVCRGCTKDPFKDIRTQADNRARAGTNVFHPASVERKFPGRVIQTEDDEGWGWKEAFEETQWDPLRRMELEAYVLVANLIHFHNGLDKQNSLVCESGHWDPQSGACSRPVIYLDDIGATFGGGSTRADHRRFLRNTVFRKPGSCDVRADLAGFGRVSEAARLLLVRRLDRLTGRMVRAIFEAAGFTRENTEATVDQWTATFMGRVEEVRRASCR